MVLLQSSDPVFEAFLPGKGPTRHQGLRITFERLELAVLGKLGSKRRLDLGIILHGRDQPWFAAIAEESLGKQHDGSHMFKGYLRSGKCGIEAMCRRMGGHDRNGTFSVPSVQGLVQVCLLGLGGDAGGRAGPLDINHDKRELRHHRKTECLGFQGESGSGGSRNGEASGIRGSDRGAYACDFIFRLHGFDP